MTHRILLTATAVTILAASTLSAQQPTNKSSTPQKSQPTQQQPQHKMVHKTTTTRKAEAPKKVELREAQPGLMSQATFSLDNALANAQKVYSGTVVSERLEKRGNELVYVFGIRGHTHRVRHVLIDAKSGDVVKPQAHARKHMQTTKKEK